MRRIRESELNGQQINIIEFFSPMFITPLPMFMEVRLEQPLKAYSPMVNTLLGISIEVRLVQPIKALSQILVTLLPMLMEARLVQYAEISVQP